MNRRDLIKGLGSLSLLGLSGAKLSTSKGFNSSAQNGGTLQGTDPHPERNLTVPNLIDPASNNPTGSGKRGTDPISKVDEPVWNWITKQLKNLPLNDQAEKDWNRFFGKREDRYDVGRVTEGFFEGLLEFIDTKTSPVLLPIFLPPTPPNPYGPYDPNTVY